MRLIELLNSKGVQGIPEKKTIHESSALYMPFEDIGANQMHDQWANIEVPEVKGIFCLIHKKVMTDGVCPKCALHPTVKQPKGGYYGTHCHICHEAVKDCGCVKLMSEEEIENIIDYCIVQREYGEERPAKFIAHAIREAMIRGGEE